MTNLWVHEADNFDDLVIAVSYTTAVVIVVVVDDWFDAGSLGCYKFLEAGVNLTWVEAQQACEHAGGYLAEPQTML